MHFRSDKFIDAKEQLLAWRKEAEKSNWQTPQDIKNRYNSVSFLGNNTVIFNIKGNNYRLVVNIAYKQQAIYVKWFGAHKEYEKKNFE